MDCTACAVERATIGPIRTRYGLTWLCEACARAWHHHHRPPPKQKRDGKPSTAAVPKIVSHHHPYNHER